MSGTTLAPGQGGALAPTTPEPPANKTGGTARTVPAPSSAPRQASSARLPGIADLPPPPAPRALPKAPTFHEESPLRALNTWGVALAVFASALTRAPLTTALNAAAGAIGGRQARDYRDYQTNLKAFDTNMRAALAQNQQDQEAYRSALTRAQYGSEDAFHKLQLAAVERHDNVMATLASQRNGIEVDRLNAMRAEAGARLALAREGVALNAEKERIAVLSLAVQNGADIPLSVLKQYGLAAPDAKAADPSAQPGGPKIGNDGDLHSSIPGVPTMKQVLADPQKYGGLNADFLRSAWLVANYRERPQVVLSSLGSRPGFRVRFMGAVAMINPHYNAQNLVMQEKARENWASGAGAKTIRSFSTAIYHLGALRSYINELGNGPIPPVNAFVNYMRAVTGNSAVTNFDTAKTVVTSEVMNALQGHATVSEANRLEDQFRRANSPAQLMGAVKTAATLLVGRLHVIRQMIVGQTGDDQLPGELIPQGSIALLRQLDAAPSAPGQVPSAAAVGASNAPVSVGQRARLANGEIVQWTGSAWVAVGR